jgi:RNA polymerase sigma factor (sigma-70 family)
MSQPVLRRVVARLIHPESDPARPTDAELLAHFAATRDEGAFAELVARHGGLVRRVARRCLGDPHAAEDVYQATFLVLARKAGAVRWSATVGPWLHAAAVRLARKARGRATTPAPVPADLPSAAVDPASAVAWAEACRAIDEELAELPESLRAPLVLCYLQGRTRDEAAHALGCSLAKLKRRLERGRNLLRDRLARRGVALPAAGVGVLATDLAVEASAIEATAKVAVAFAARGTAPAGVAALVGASQTVRAKLIVALLAAALLACGVAFASFPRPDEKPDAPNPAPPVPAAADKADADGPGEALPAGATARLGTTRLRPGGSVERLAFSPDGTKVAAWSGDSHTTDALTVWDTKTGRLLRRVDLPGARVDLLAWLADGRGVALVRSSYDDPVPFIWEFTDEKAAKPEVKPRKQGGGFDVRGNQPVPDNEHDSCYAISPDGKVLAIGRAGNWDSEREVQLWELKTGVKVNALKPLKGGVIHPGNCGEIYFTPDSKALVVFTAAKYLGDDRFEDELLVTAWNLATSREKSRFKAPRPATNGRSAVALSDTTLAVGLENGETSLWDLTTGKERKLATGHDSKKPGHGYGTYAVAFTPDGKTLVTGGRDNTTKLWDVASGNLLHTLRGHYSWVQTLATSPDGKLLASSGQDGVIRLWDVANGIDACPLPGHKYTVGGVALSPDGKLAVTAGWDDTLRWWDAAKGAELRSVTVPDGIMGMTLSPDGKTVLVATDDGKLRTWDAATGRETTPANLPADVKFEYLTFTPDGKHLVAASGPKVTVWEWPALKLARTIELPKPDKTVLANPPEDSETRCRCVAVSPDGKWLVSVAYRYWFRERDGLRLGSASDGVADVWEFATGKRVRRLAEANGTFRTGTFTADGKFVLIGSGGTIPGDDDRGSVEFGGEMNLFDAVAGRHVRGFDVPPMPDTVAVRYSGASVLSPDGRTLYVSYNTGEIVAYEVATGKPRRTFAGHRGYIAALAMSADGRRLISSGNDGVALVWDATPR